MTRHLHSGTVLIWLCGATAALSIMMIAGLVLFILVNGLGSFWPRPVVELGVRDGSTLLGEAWGREEIGDGRSEPVRHRLHMKIGNRELWGLDFRRVDESEIVSKRFPDSVLVIERRTSGNFIGYPRELRHAGVVAAGGAARTTSALYAHLDEYKDLHRELAELREHDFADIDQKLEHIRLAIKHLGVTADTTSAATRGKLHNLNQEQAELERLYEALEKKYAGLRAASEQNRLVMQAANGAMIDIPATQVLNAFQPNNLSFLQKTGFFCRRFWEFLTNGPREANMEGGIFPAIFGTVLMVLLMSVAVSPLGVLAAVYMREYARQGPLLQVMRVMVTNLAGVPSVVVGVFGLAFFVYGIGGSIDRVFYPETLPTPTFGTGGILWASLTLALLTVPVVIVATEEGLAAVPANIREGSIALGATKIETLGRIVLPAASPGILTGLILAMARAAGEVAPLMITGVVKLAPDLPLDGRFPFVHLERKFMHLGFHIYDVGFQSPNIDASVPVVFATTMLLIVIVVVLNLLAITLRSRLRKRFSVSYL